MSHSDFEHGTPQHGAAAPPDGAHGERPTRARYGVLGFSVAMAVILYLDRMAISVPLLEIADDLSLSEIQVGDAVAVFYFVYAVFQVPAGLLGDRWGGRRALTLYVCVWSAAMAGLGLATGLASLMVMRVLLGMGQAGAYATTASFLRRWFPLARRGFANSAVSLGGRAGGAVAPALTPVLMAVAGAWLIGVDRWRPVFLAYAAVGFVWSIVFWFWFRDVPRQHRRANAAEIALVAEGEPAGDSDQLAGGRIPVRAMLASRSLWLMSLMAFCVNVGWIFLATWLPTYLIKVHGATDQQAGFYTSLTAFAGMAGCLAGGVATDYFVRRIGLQWARRVCGMTAYGGAALSLVGCWILNDATAIGVLLVASSFLGDFAIGSVWASCQDVGGRYAGTVLGFANMCGNLGAACAASFIGRLVLQFDWPAVFAMAGAAYTVATLAWLGVDVRARIDRQDEVAVSNESPQAAG